MVSLKQLGDLANQCIKCGLCLPWCPVYQNVLMEEACPRGRIQLAKRFLYPKHGEEIEPSEELAKAFYTCTACNACSRFCPSQIKPSEVIHEGRERLFSANAAPGLLVTIRNNILDTKNVYAGKKEDRTAIYPSALKKRLEGLQQTEEVETLLFLGCVGSYLDMKIIPSLIKIMDAARLRYTLLASEEICCGLPLYLMGDNQAFTRNARDLIELIKATGAKEIVTPCAGCYKVFKSYYSKVGNMDIQVYHSIHYIQKLIHEKSIKLRLNSNKIVTYHDPCDLGNSFEVYEEPREILKTAIGTDPVEMERNRSTARCCGGGGSVVAIDPELAAHMASTRVLDAAEVGAQVIVSGCPTCKDNLRKGLKAIPKGKRPKLKVMDITEVVASAIVEQP